MKHRKMLVIGAVLFLLLGSASAGTVLDDFEDGDISEYGGDTGSYTIISGNNVIDGTYSLNASSSGTDAFISDTGITTEQGYNYSVWVDISSGGNVNPLVIGTQSENGAGSLYGYFIKVEDNNNRMQVAKRESSGRTVLATSSSYSSVGAGDERLEVAWTKNNWINATLYGSGGSVLAQVQAQDSTWSTGGVGFGVFDGTYQIDNLTKTVLSNPPVFNSKSVEPDPPLIGEYVNYSASTSDSDGSISETCLQVNFSGSQVFSDCKSSSSPSWDQVYKPSSSGWLNATFNTTDNDGATTTESLDRYLSDDAPSVTVNKPSGDKFTYDTTYDFSVTDSDSYPEEDWNCDVKKDGTTEESVYLKEGTNSSYSTTIRSNQGSHTAKVECTDNNGNTGSDTNSYTVKRIDVQSSSASSPVYETENITYNTQVKVGDMVNNLTTELYWNSSSKHTVFNSNNGINTYNIDNYHTIPLVPSNNTDFNWNTKNTINYNQFSSGTSTDTENSSTNTQTVYHAFSFENQTLDKNDYLEYDDIEYTSYIRNHTDKSTITGELSITQDDYFQTKNLPKTRDLAKYRKYQTEISSTEVDFNGLQGTAKNETAYLNSSYEISFNSDTRTITPNNVSTDIHKITITQCNGNGATALNFTTYQENNRSIKVESTFRGSWNAYNADKPGKFSRSYNFTSTGQKTHSFCIIPGDEELLLDTEDKKIVYEYKNDTYTTRAYYLINETISNQTTEIPLYMLKTADASEVEFSVEDTSGNQLSEVVIETLRYFPGDDKFITVAMSRTGSQGSTRTFLEFNEIDYKYMLYQNKNLLKETDQQVLPQDLEVLFTVGEDQLPGYYEREASIDYGCNNNATEIRCSYSGPDSLSQVTLEVAKDEPIGYASEDDPQTNETEYCETSSISGSATLICNGLNLTQNRYKYNLEATFNDGTTIGLENGFLGNLSPDPYGETGLFIYLMMFVTMSFAGLWKPEAAIALGMLSTIMASMTGFLVVSQTALISILALGAVMIWRMS